MLPSKLPTSLLIVSFLLAVTGSTAAAATVGRQCRRDCRLQHEGCVDSFRADFVAAKGGCADRECRREARRLKQANTKRCRAGRGECASCCHANPGAGCNVEVLGDELCAGFVEPDEQCDGRDADMCPGACNACKCPEPSAPFVGSIDASAAVLTFVYEGPGPQVPFSTFDGFVVDVMFETDDDIVSTQGAAAGNCTVDRYMLAPAGALYTPLDAGASGQMSTGSAVAELVRPSASGRMEPVDLPAALVVAGFGSGSEIEFSFPGGADIGPFEASVVIPPALELSVPDVRDPSWRLDRSRALELVWVPRDPQATIAVFLGSLSATESVLARCNLPDTGTGEVPAVVVAQLSADATIVDVMVHRGASELINVPLTRGGTGIVQLGGFSSVRWRHSKQTVTVAP